MLLGFNNLVFQWGTYDHGSKVVDIWTVNITYPIAFKQYVNFVSSAYNQDNLKNNRTCTTTTIVKSLSYATTGWFGASSNACRYMDWAAIGY